MKAHILPTPAKNPARRFVLRLAGALATLLLLAQTAGAATLYYTGASGQAWTTSTSTIAWATDAVSSPSTYWTNGNAAEIVTASPEIRLYNITATTLTVDNGATFYQTGTGTTSYGLTLSGGGSGNFALRDDRTTAGASFKALLTGTSAWNGTITVNGSTTSTVSVVIDSNLGTTGSTGVNTKIQLVSNGNLEIGPGAIGGTATIGELSGSGKIKFPGQFSTTGGTRTLKVDQSTNTTFSGTIGENLTRTDHILAFTKAGTGTLSISGTGGYEGATTVEGGKLFLSGTYGTGFTGVTGQGNYIVKNGALLGVDGTLSLSTGATARNVTIESGGILKPGGENAVGTMTLAGGNASSVGLAFLGSATIEFRLGSAQDSIVLSSTPMIGSAAGGTGSIAFDLINNGDVMVGNTYDLISFGGTTQGIALDSFALSGASMGDGWAGTFSYGGDGNLLQFTVNAVPEPRVALLAGIGIAVVLFGLRKKTGAHNRG